MSNPKADDAQLACAAQQGAALVRHPGTQARTTFAAPGSSKRRKAMPKSVKLLSFGLLAVVAVAAGDLFAARLANPSPRKLTITVKNTTDTGTENSPRGDRAGGSLNFHNQEVQSDERKL